MSDVTLDDTTRIGDALPRSTVDGLSPIALDSSHRDLLARFFEGNPRYFIDVNGTPPTRQTARDELDFDLPDGWTYTRKCVIGYVDEAGNLAAIASVISDLLAYGVWHVGLLLIADDRQGTGQARTLYRDLESWALANGACGMRLGVVLGNGRAERFWTSLGYVEMRTRAGVVMGRKTNTVRVMVKPLSGDLGRYLALMPRDRSE